MYARMAREAAHKRELVRQLDGQKLCKNCTCSNLLEGMTNECCLTKQGKRCQIEETGKKSTSMPATRPRTASPLTETRQASGTSKEGRAKPEKPGTDTDQAPSTVIRVVDDQATRGEIDDPEAFEAFARSFGLS